MRRKFTPTGGTLATKMQTVKLACKRSVRELLTERRS